MISVIVCSRDPSAASRHKAHVERTVGAPFEYIRIDNSSGALGLAAAYNRGLASASGDILAFMHDDVWPLETGWGATLLHKFAADSSVGLIGVAGTQYLFADHPGWVAAGRPFIKGKVVHEMEAGAKKVLTVFDPRDGDFEVVAVDGLFFAVRASLFGLVSFDEQTFDRYHFYDLDIAVQVRHTHRLIVTTDLMVCHESGGSFDEEWHRYGRRFLEKYRGELPASCVTEVPDPARRVPFESFDVTEKFKGTSVR